MRAMLLDQTGPVTAGSSPLASRYWPRPQPGPGELLIQVGACGVCHTELDEIEGRATPPHLPVIPGHQAVGRVVELGPGTPDFALGDRVGVGWFHSSCGHCRHCRAGDENLCAEFLATGRDRHGGYAEFLCVPAGSAFRIPPVFTDAEAAPLLCAGAIGHRSLRLARLVDGQPLGLQGFGASAHLVLKLARHLYPQSPLYVFARDREERAFALELGATWSGATQTPAPEPLAAVIDTTPAWTPVLAALGALAPGGRLVINAIRKEAGDQSAWLGLDYPSQLWMEKEIKSVANVARRDIREFLALAAEIPIRPQVEEYPLADANRALVDLKTRRARGAKVLRLD